MKKELLFGQEIRREQLRRWKEEVPKPHKIIKNDIIDFEIWFNKYKRLINFGVREILKQNNHKNKLILKYTNYVNKKKELFVNIFPRKIKIDENFQYFFGLWCGDRLGAKRFGISNKSKEVSEFTYSYLKKLYQNPEHTLVYNAGIEKPNLDYVDKIYENKSETKVKGWVVNTGTNNGVLYSFFRYLYDNIDEFITFLPNKNIFLAGLFDAEGNVSLEDCCYRFACKNKTFLEFLKKLMISEEIFRRYDGANLVCYNLSYLRYNLAPFLNNKDKLNRISLIFEGKGVLEPRFLMIVEFIKNKPGSTQKQIAKALKRVKVSAQLIFLRKLGYLDVSGYPLRYYSKIK